MISLLDAIRLCRIQEWETIWIRKEGESHWSAIPTSREIVRDRPELQKINVISIRPRFSSDYKSTFEGLEFEVRWLKGEL